MFCHRVVLRTRLYPYIVSFIRNDESFHQKLQDVTEKNARLRSTTAINSGCLISSGFLKISKVAMRLVVVLHGLNPHCSLRRFSNNRCLTLSMRTNCTDVKLLLLVSKILQKPWSTAANTNANDKDEAVFFLRETRRTAVHRFLE